MCTIKELQEFPAIFTFKIVGTATEPFPRNVETIFDLKDREVKISVSESSGGKYKSFSVTTIVMTYEELEEFYKSISILDGLKFYV